MTTWQNLDLKLKALADPQRRRILDLLAERDRGVAELAAECALSAATVSHHLSALRTAGLAGMRREGRHHDYFLLPAGPAEIIQWLNLLRQHRSRPAWNQEAYREQALRTYLEHPEHGLPRHPRHRQVVLDWFHSLLERNRLYSMDELSTLWAPIGPAWETVLEALLELGSLQRKDRYILVSD